MNKGVLSVNLLKRLYNAWKNSRFRQYELRLAAADADLREAVVQFRIAGRTIDRLNSMIAELTAENGLLADRNADLVDLAFRQADRIADLECERRRVLA